MSMVVIVVTPILLTLFVLLKTKGDMVTTSPLLLPPLDRTMLQNFAEVLSNKYLLIGFKNTGIILMVSIFFNMLLGTVTAFTIELFNLRFKKAIVAMFFMGCWCRPSSPRLPL